MSATNPQQESKPKGIDVLRCAAPACSALLAYEVDGEGFLYVDLAWTARSTPAGDSYFPCPRCSARNILEFATDARGHRRARVATVEQAG